MKPAVIAALASLIVFSGCNAQKTNDALRASYKQSFLKECIRGASAVAGETVAHSYCICETNAMMKRLSTADLVELPLHLAPRRVRDEADAMTKRCADAATALLYRRDSCNSGVTVTYPARPRLPKSVPPQAHRVTAGVEVTILTNGLAKDPRIYRSSGNRDIDRQALKAATATTYWPKFVRCRPVESRYLFTAVFE